MGSLAWSYLGRIDYPAAREIQERLAAQRHQGAVGDLLLALEHPAVVTVGRGWRGARRDAADARASSDAPWLVVDRGGGPTYHGPGQLVLYPVVALRSGGRGVRTFVDALERALCDAAVALGVAAITRSGLPGAWIETPAGWRKLASIGIGVRRGVTLHGAALNVERDAESGFRDFSPCGLPDVRPTSIESERGGSPPALAEVARIAARALSRRLEIGPAPAEIHAEEIATTTTSHLEAPGPAGAVHPLAEAPRSEEHTSELQSR